MTQAASDTLKELNKSYFNEHVDEIVWNAEKAELRIKMITRNKLGAKDEFVYHGDIARDIYKKLA